MRATTFQQMRGDATRQHVRLSDLLDMTEATGRRWTAWEIKRLFRGMPKPRVKKYAHWHYEERHVEAVRAAVEAEVERCKR